MSEELDTPSVEPSASEKFYNSESDKAEAPEEVVAVLEKDPEETVVVESEEPEAKASETEEDAGTLVYEVGEREITQKQILEWEQGYLRQSDYTQKTQGVADKVKTEVAKKVSESIGDLDTKAAALTEHATALTALLDEAEGSAELEELREDDYTEYQKTLETINKKREKAKEATEAAQKATEDAKTALDIQQQALFIDSNPEWTGDDGQPTVKREEDFKLIDAYAKANKFTSVEFAKITDHKLMNAILEASRYRQLKLKTTEAKKVKVAPKLVKPTQLKSTKTDNTQSAGDKFYANAKS